MSCRVLIVDDNGALAENVAELLELAGHRPVTFEDPRRAIEWAHQHRFDVALMDLCMPQVDGATLRRSLSEIEPNATYVLLTAYDGGEIEAQMKGGFDAVWSKPIPLAELLTLLAWRARPGPARVTPKSPRGRVLAGASGSELPPGGEREREPDEE